jgi:CO/xanthine dehydrogenase FAD-binding subunit
VRGIREIPIEKAYLDIGKSAINPSKEILVGIRLEKCKKGEGSDYQRVAMRKAMALPILACAVFVQPMDRSMACSRIAIGPVSNAPFRARKTEDFLKGKSLTPEIFERAGEIASEEVTPRDSRLRGSRIYRKGLTAVLVRRGLEGALAKIG